MNIQKYDVLLVDFPFSNLEETKLRPALVIKTPEGKNTILCQITTKKPTIFDYSISLNRHSCNGDIRFDSYINVDIIFTSHESLIHKKIGFIKDEKVINEVNSKIKSMFFS
ncbi:MAG: type II toxin-antitoxin system PemK/MazF family toxin [archaeon]|nr:type II toxin-antitoxin system PemK/MazF family toxin [archaeon]